MKFLLNVKQTIIFCIFFLFSSFVYAENADFADRLIDDYDKEMELGNGFLYVNYEKAQKHFGNAIKIAKLNRNITQEIDAMGKLSIAHIWAGGEENFTIGEKYILEARDKALRVGYEKGIAMSYLREGVLHYDMGNLNLALKKYHYAVPYFERLKDTLEIIGTYQNIASVYTDLEQLDKAIESELTALKLAETQENTLKKVVLNCNIGYSYLDKKNARQARRYFLSADSISHSLSLKDQLGEKLAILTGLGSAYYLEKKYRLAKEKCLEAIQFHEANGHPQTEPNYLYAINILSKSFLALNDLDKAGIYLDKLKNILDKTPYLTHEIALVENLRIYYLKKGDYKQAFIYSEKYKTLSDSLKNENVLNNINFYTTQFEAEKKDVEILAQNLKIKEQENKVLKTSKTKNSLIVVTAVLLILCISIFIFFRQKQSLKNKEIEDLRNRNKINNLIALMDGEEKERERLAKELHDGILGELAAIKHQISLFNKVDQVKKDQSMSTLDSSINQIRNISHNLAPPIILDSNLIDALKYYCSRVSSTFCKIHFQSFGEYKKLDTKVETSIYRIVQELLTNIKKHSKATKAIVEIGVIGKVMRIVVEDNGIGMQENVPQKGIGLNNIKSRLKVLNADLEIDTSNKGTAFYIELNIDEHQYDSVYDDTSIKKIKAG